MVNLGLPLVLTKDATGSNSHFSVSPDVLTVPVVSKGDRHENRLVEKQPVPSPEEFHEEFYSESLRCI